MKTAASALNKKCVRCDVVNPSCGFYRDSQKVDGLRPYCKACERDRMSAARNKDLEARRRKEREWRANRLSNPDARRRCNDALRSYRRRNPEKTKAAKKRANDAARLKKGGALEKSVRHGVWRSLAGKKVGKTFSLLGYSAAELISHIERQFTKGMSWDNYGEWHLDHILPLSSFEIDGPDSEGFRRAWALPNLRPLWAKQNLSKCAKVETLL